MRFFLPLIILVSLGACKTSRDIQKDKTTNNAIESSGVKTLDAPPEEAAPAAGISQGYTGTGTRTPRKFSNEDLQMKLAVALGEIENLRFQVQQNAISQTEASKSLVEENQRLKDALNELQRKAALPIVASKSSSKGKKGRVVDSLWGQGVSMIKQGKYQEALVAMTTILESYPKSNRVWGATLTSGMIQYGLKNYKEAALRFNEAIDLAAKRSRGVSLPWYFQGNTFYKMGKNDDAELFWGELARKYPKSLVNRKLVALKSRKKMRVSSDLFKDVPKWENFVGVR